MKEFTRSFHLTSIRENEPGPKWQGLFNRLWPHYEKWFLSEGHRARPGYVTSSKMLRTHMPELMPTYERLVDLAGGGDLAARFLSFYRPPPYLLACSQAAWTRRQPTLVRNYDYSPSHFEWTLLYTCWRRPVIAMSDCLWGVLDGINDAGLSVALAFGGRKIIGDGFGVPLVLRYVLEVCNDVTEACRALRRVAVHMAYNVSLLDRDGNVATVYLAPDRKARIVHSPVSTNHQDRIEWPAYARMSETIERRAYLEKHLADPHETKACFINRFLQPPIHQTRYDKAFGTLYTAAYHPARCAVDYHWPGQHALRQSLSAFREGRTLIHLSNSQQADAALA